MEQNQKQYDSHEELIPVGSCITRQGNPDNFGNPKEIVTFYLKPNAERWNKEAQEKEEVNPIEILLSELQARAKSEGAKARGVRLVMHIVKKTSQQGRPYDQVYMFVKETQEPPTGGARRPTPAQNKNGNAKKRFEDDDQDDARPKKKKSKRID